MQALENRLDEIFKADSEEENSEMVEVWYFELVAQLQRQLGYQSISLNGLLAYL